MNKNNTDVIFQEFLKDTIMMSSSNYESSIINIGTVFRFVYLMDNIDANQLTNTLVTATAVNILMQTDDILANTQENEISNYINIFRITNKINQGTNKLKQCNRLLQKRKEINDNIKGLIQDKYQIISTLKTDLQKIYNGIYNKKYSQYQIQCRRDGIDASARDHYNTQKGKATQFAFEFISNYFGQIDKKYWSTHQYIHQYKIETNWLFEHVQEINGFEIGADEEQITRINFEADLGKMSETLLRQTGQWCHKLFALDNIKRIRASSNVDKLQEFIEQDDLIYEAIKKIKIDKYDYWFPFVKIIETNKMYKNIQEKLKIRSMPNISSGKSNELEDQLIELQNKIDMESVNLSQCQDTNETLQEEINRLEIELSNTQDGYHETQDELQESYLETERWKEQVMGLEESNNDLTLLNDDLQMEYDLLMIKFNKYKANVERQSNKYNAKIFQQTLDLNSEESSSDSSISSVDIDNNTIQKLGTPRVNKKSKKRKHVCHKNRNVKRKKRRMNLQPLSISFYDS